MLGPQCQLFSGLHVSVRILTDYNRELARRGYHLLLVAIKKLGLKAGIANEVVHIGFLLCVLCVEPQEKSLITGLYELKKAPSHVVKGEILEVCGLQTWYLWFPALGVMRQELLVYGLVSIIRIGMVGNA